LAAVAGLDIRVFESLRFICMSLLAVQFPGIIRVSTFPWSFLKKLDQTVDQALLPANNVQAAFVTVLLENLAQIALQISHRSSPERGFSETLLRPNTAQQTLTQDSGAGSHRFTTGTGHRCHLKSLIPLYGATAGMRNEKFR
jgi:hypothetical protein